MFEGGSPSSNAPLPPEFRDWVLASKFGWTKQQIDEQPAVWLDWLLAIEGEKSEAEEAMERRSRNAR